ncbi:MAG: hypothetical protein Ct9H90mP11_07900 [Acidimicrobiales bacterium]|nr:MAG: hypothetical protein Ct9H90mP11_07900 [Acidimicrobiales bacterium]
MESLRWAQTASLVILQLKVKKMGFALWSLAESGLREIYYRKIEKGDIELDEENSETPLYTGRV